jgi:hypothetical protein
MSRVAERCAHEVGEDIDPLRGRCVEEQIPETPPPSGLKKARRRGVRGGRRLFDRSGDVEPAPAQPLVLARGLADVPLTLFAHTR